MPRVVEVNLFQAVCNSGAGDPIQLTGNIYGATFQNNPDDPHEETSRAPIYSFPNGPISISQDQTVPIKMPRGVPFSLSSPTTEPADLNPKYLKFGGDLNNGLRSNFQTIDYTTELGACLEAGSVRFDVTFTDGGSLKITLSFGVCIQSIS